jgi:two-component system response regulator WspF
VRIGIVDDLSLARRALETVVRSVPGYVVAWQACDGEEAVRLAKNDTPDVILMDLNMPVLNGVEATRRIMQQSPCPILIVTASVQTNIRLVLEAMSHGGLDAVNTPVLAGGQVRDGEPLLARLARLERTKCEGRRTSEETRQDAGKSTVILPAPSVPTFLALGASTGGPAALAAVLEALPANFAAPVVVIQHMHAEFIPGLIDLLRGQCRLPVEVARTGEMPRPGVISVAMTDDHLILSRTGRFAVVREPVDYPFRPSVSVFFESLKMHLPWSGVAVLLTGMGDDGATGLLALRRAGWFTMAQDESSCVVYGMPKAAAERGAASRVLPLADLPGAILARFASRKTELRS